jgi:hypothetical protein
LESNQASVGCVEELLKSVSHCSMVKTEIFAYYKFRKKTILTSRKIPKPAP